MAFGGNRDRHAMPAQIVRWGGRTSRRFEFRIFDGGHFYLDEHRDELISELRRALGVPSRQNLGKPQGLV
jgi:surfactin synthase thioesterase subunit